MSAHVTGMHVTLQFAGNYSDHVRLLTCIKRCLIAINALKSAGGLFLFSHCSLPFARGLSRLTATKGG